MPFVTRQDHFKTDENTYSKWEFMQVVSVLNTNYDNGISTHKGFNYNG